MLHRKRFSLQIEGDGDCLPNSILASFKWDSARDMQLYDATMLRRQVAMYMARSVQCQISDVRCQMSLFSRSTSRSCVTCNCPHLFQKCRDALPNSVSWHSWVIWRGWSWEKHPSAWQASLLLGLLPLRRETWYDARTDCHDVIDFRSRCRIVNGFFLLFRELVWPDISEGDKSHVGPQMYCGEGKKFDRGEVQP